MNARQSFYSSVFEQINEYKKRKNESSSSRGFLADHMLELGIFSAILVVGVFGGFVFNTGNYFDINQRASRSQFFKFTQAPASDIFEAEKSSASEGGTESSFSGTIVRPSDDGYVSQDNPQRSYGADSLLRVNKNPQRLSYIKFRIPESINYSNATLKIYSRDKNTNGGTIYFVSDNLWSERLLTFDSRPESVPEKIMDMGSVSPGNAVSIDVTRFVNKGDTVTFLLSTNSDDGVDFSSKEDSLERSPQLLLSE